MTLNTTPFHPVRVEFPSICVSVGRYQNNDSHSIFDTRLACPEAMELMYDLALETAMRMSEIFTITLDQVDLKQSTIFLDRTKNGNKRQVPLTTVAKRRIEEYRQIVNTAGGSMAGFAFENGTLLPFWQRDVSKAGRKKVSDRMSQQWGKVFENAGAAGLNFHDLRHEATSRFFERTTMTEFKIMVITGHSSTRMLKRYANLRASKLAPALW